MSTIVYWLADRTACGYYRCLLPGSELEKRGDTVIAEETMTMDAIDRADVFVGQRVAKTGPSKLWQALAREKGRGKLMVYELDDDVFALPQEMYNPNSTVWPALLDNVRDNLACADVVTVSTAPLAEIVAIHTSAPVHVIPNAVPDFLPDMMLPLREHARMIGWSGSATHDGDWAHNLTVNKILQWFRSSTFGQGRILRTFGSFPAPLRDCLSTTAAPHHVHTDGTPDIQRYYKMLSRWFDVGLAPLAPTAFNYAKSDLRLLELAALGIPWIASNVGPYAVDEGEARGGLRVVGHTTWHEALTAIVSDENMRRTLRMNGRQWAETRMISQVLPEWERVLCLVG